MDPNDELIYTILRRPRMYLPHIKRVRELLIFIAGVKCGLYPPLGAHWLVVFDRFLNRRLATDSSSIQKPFTLCDLAQEPIGVLCERIAELYKEWVVSGEHNILIGNIDLSVYDDPQ